MAPCMKSKRQRSLVEHQNQPSGARHVNSDHRWQNPTYRMHIIQSSDGVRDMGVDARETAAAAPAGLIHLWRKPESKSYINLNNRLCRRKR